MICSYFFRSLVTVTTKYIILFHQRINTFQIEGVYKLILFALIDYTQQTHLTAPLTLKRQRASLGRME